MPDKKVKDATLAGVDTTGIGIRDDVYIWIYTHYSSKTQRTILMTMAKAVQNIMIAPPKTTEEAIKYEQSYKDASMMLKAVRNLEQRSAAEMDELLFMQSINTPERLEAYLQYNLLLTTGKTNH